MIGALKRILTVSLLGGALGLAIAPAPEQLPGITNVLIAGGAAGVPACSITGGTTSVVNGQNAYHFTSTSGGTISCSTPRTMYYLVVGGGGSGGCGTATSGASYASGGGGAAAGVKTGLISFPTTAQSVSIGAG